MSDSNKTTLFTVLMFFAMLSWGGTWPSGKVLTEYTRPEVLIFWRFLATFLSMIPVLIVLKVPLKLEKPAFFQVLTGSILLIAYMILFFLGIKFGLAGAAGTLVSTLIPVCTFVISVLIHKLKFGLRQIAGLILGILGGLILMRIWELDLGKLYSGGNLFLLAAAVLWAFLTLTTQKSQKYMPSLAFSFYIYGISTVLDLIIALPHDVLGVFSFGSVFWLNLFNISVIGTTFGTTTYFLASSKLGASRASSFTFLVPASALIFSWIWLKEQPQITTIVGGILAMIAVYIINSKGQEPLLSKAYDS